MARNERLQGGPERRMDPHRLEDLNHQLDAYPLKDEAQRERLIKAILADQPEGEGQENSGEASSSFDDEGI